MKHKQLHWLPLAHHRRADADRCLKLPLPGARRLALCARCSALYPAAVAALAAQLWLDLGDPAPAGLDWLVVAALAPALVDWTLARLAMWRGSNPIRMLTGALAGLALGRGLMLYFRDPGSEVWWTAALLGVCLVVAVEIVKRLDLKHLS